MAKFESIKKITVTEQIMEQIASLITSGNLQPGEQLPPERDLAVELGVTRGRIREALRALSLVGLVTIKAGEGTFVSLKEMPIPGETIAWMFHKEIDNLDEVYAARKLIESAIYMSAVDHMEESEYAPLESMLDELVALSDTGTPEKLAGLLDHIDIYVGDRCGNQIYAKLMQTIIHLRRQTSLKLLSVPGAAKTGAENRQRIVEQMKAGNRSAASQALSAFFSQSHRFYRKIGE